MIGSTADLSEEVIRASLHRRLVAKHQDEKGVVLIDELGLCKGSARVDLAVVGNQLHGYEIKSDRDSLRRLRTQAGYTARCLIELLLSPATGTSLGP